MYSAMNNIRSITIDAARLAERVATGLHSLAQPLAVSRLQLEVAEIPGNSAELRERATAAALVALGRAIDQLDLLRELIRPFRASTEFTTSSIQEGLVLASDLQVEALQNEGVQVNFRKGCAQGMVVAPSGFVQRIMLSLFELLRSVAPVVANFDISESERGVQLIASLAYPASKDISEEGFQTASTTIQAYIEVLTGEFAIDPDLSSIRLWLPKEACSAA
jgi:hypothetical protein